MRVFIWRTDKLRLRAGIATAAGVGAILTSSVITMPNATAATRVTPVAGKPAGGIGAPAPKRPERKTTPGVPLATPSQTSPEQSAAEAAAQAKAKATGKPVVVEALATEASDVVANPSGSFSLTQHAEPVRVKHGAAWTPVDLTLRQDPDGTVSPAASAAGLTFSGGGSGPLARMSEDADSVTLTWPTPLPTPTLHGDTATYPDVLPGVDLVVTATVDGFSDDLVVKTRSAAANPRLRTVKFGLRASGLSLRTDAEGVIEAVGADGIPIITAPAPTMWDTPPTQANSTRGQGSGARHAQVGVTLHDAELSLTPDQALLSDSATGFPVTIDPFFGGRRQHWAMADSQWPTTSFFDGANWKYQKPIEPRVGHAEDPRYGAETVRSYFQMDARGLAGKDIIAAHFNAFNDWSWTCHAEPIELWWTGAISPRTTWRNMPSQLGRGPLRVSTESHGYQGCPPAAIGYEVGGFVRAVAAQGWASATLGLRAGNERDVNQFKRFHNDPTLQVEYDSPPGQPSGPRIERPDVPCATSPPYPWIGRTADVTPPMMAATYPDADGGDLVARYHYWIDGTSTDEWSSGHVAANSVGRQSIDPAFLSKVQDGQTIDWQTQATNGRTTGPGTPVCHVNVQRTAPDAPTISSADGNYPPADKGMGKAAGTPGSFAIAAAGSGSDPVKYAYSIDQDPPSPDSVVTADGGNATVSLTPVSPGLHMVYAYAIDRAGNASQVASYAFTVPPTVGRTFDNLADALNNTAVADDNAAGQGNADGGGFTLSRGELAYEGWHAGETVTVNGARFHLPAFGQGHPDNVVAANQTINLHGASGKSLVFLTTSTNARSSVPDTQARESATTPNVPQGVNVAGSHCKAMTNGQFVDCTTPSGHITYRDGSSADYTLAVPDWVSGPAKLAAVTLQHRRNPDGSQESEELAPKLYAFAVPIKAGAPITSVTLPDVSAGVSPTDPAPALHIFGITTRDTTSGPGGSWTGAWTSPIEQEYNVNNAPWRDQTIRVTLRPSISGATLRVRLDNPLGRRAVRLDHVTIARQERDAAPSETPSTLTFGGQRSANIAAGAQVYSDPLDFPITANQNLLLSESLAGSYDYLPMHDKAQALEFTTPAGSGDHTADTDPSHFSVHCYCSAVATALDVATTGDAGAVAFVGGAQANGTSSGSEKGIDNDLAAILAQQADGAPIGVVNTANATGGISAGDQLTTLSRLDRDVLSVPNLRTVIIWPDVSDAAASSAALVENGLSPLTMELAANHINVIVGTITPCGGSFTCALYDSDRKDVNNWIRGLPNTVTAKLPKNQALLLASLRTPLDFSTVVVAPASGDQSEALRHDPPPNDFDNGDHVSLTDDAYLALARSVNLEQLR